MALKFHLDEHVAYAIASGLRRRGISVSTTEDAGLRGGKDREHLRFGLAQTRVVFTHDPDFLDLHGQGVQHAGIAYCPEQKYGKRHGPIIAKLASLSMTKQPEDMHNRVEYI